MDASFQLEKHSENAPQIEINDWRVYFCLLFTN